MLLRPVTMALKTLFQTYFQNCAILGGIRSAGCWLSRPNGSQNAIVLMLRKLLLLEGSLGKCIIPYLLAKYAKITPPFFFVAKSLSTVTGKFK